MKPRIGLLSFGLVLLMGLAAPAVRAAHPDVERARVVDVQPVYAYESYPVEVPVCRSVRHVRGPDPSASVLVGAVVGGVIGNQFGDGRGRRLATLAGAGIGAAVGHELGREADSHRRHRHAPPRRCHTEIRYEQREVLIGYDVAYRYNGRIRQVRMDREPGRFIDIEVSVRPLG